MSEWIFNGYTWITTRSVVFLMIYFILDAMKYAISGEYVAMGLAIVFSAICIPLVLITYGGIKYKGLSSKFIDLSTYTFTNESLHEDFEMEVDEMNRLNDALEFEARKKSDGENLFALARKIAIERNLSPKSYMLLLVEAAIHMGEIREKSNGKLYGNRATTNNDTDLKEKIRALKQKMEEDRKNTRDSDSDSGKYSFL